jgi:hypothetical protein
VLFGLAQMLGEDPAELGVAGDAGRGPHLDQRLLLDGVRVGQVLRELLVDRAFGHVAALPDVRASEQATGARDSLHAPMPDIRRLLAFALVASPLGLGGCAHREPAATAAARRSAEPARHAARLVPRRAEHDAPAPLVASSTGIAAARRFARTRTGTVAFAVLDGRGRLRGLRRTVQFPSASVSKAMLMVAVLRRARDRPLSVRERALLRPMVTASDNDAADVVYAAVGGPGLSAVAAEAGSQRFADIGHWAAALITAADQARLFMRIDALVPARHRAYARALLSSIVHA